MNNNSRDISVSVVGSIHNVTSICHLFLRFVYSLHLRASATEQHASIRICVVVQISLKKGESEGNAFVMGTEQLFLLHDHTHTHRSFVFEKILCTAQCYGLGASATFS
jgi:hypothetical protein